MKKLSNALSGSQNKESVESIVKEGGEFQEVFKILEGGRHNLSQLEVKVDIHVHKMLLYDVTLFFLLLLLQPSSDPNSAITLP